MQAGFSLPPASFGVWQSPKVAALDARFRGERIKNKFIKENLSKVYENSFFSTVPSNRQFGIRPPSPGPINNAFVHAYGASRYGRLVGINQGTVDFANFEQFEAFFGKPNEVSSGVIPGRRSVVEIGNYTNSRADLWNNYVGFLIGEVSRTRNLTPLQSAELVAFAQKSGWLAVVPNTGNGLANTPPTIGNGVASSIVILPIAGRSFDMASTVNDRVAFTNWQTANGANILALVSQAAANGTYAGTFVALTNGNPQFLRDILSEANKPWETGWTARLKKDPNNPGLNLLQIEPVGFSKIGSDIGGILGRSIGRLLFKDDTASFVSSAVFGALGQQVGGYLGGGQTAIESIQLGFKDVTNLKSGILTSGFTNAAIGTVSSFLSVELADALGLDGDIGKVFGSLTSSMLEVSFQNALNGVDLLTGLKNFFTTPSNGTFFDTGFSNALGSTLASFFAVKLGSMIYSPQTQAGVTLSSIGSAVGGWAFGSAAFGTSVSGLGLGTGVGSWFAGKLGGGAAAQWLGLNVIAPGLGILIGFVLGAIIGDLFGKKKQRTPSAWADMVLNTGTGRFELGVTIVSNGGNLELARNMSTITRETLNGIIDTIAAGQKAKVVWTNGWNLTARFGHEANTIKVGLGGGALTTVSSADEAVDKAVLWALPNLSITGGNMFLKRAIARTTATSVAVMSGDMQIAEDYGFYLQNRAVIDAAIAEPYTSMRLGTVDYLSYMRINLLQAYKDDPANSDPNAKDLAKMRAWGERKVTEFGNPAWIVNGYAVAANEDSNFYDANKAFMTRALAKDSVALTGGDLSFYNANQTQVDRIISRLALTQFAASWIITLQRAAELKITQASASDFNGGAQGFADSLRLMSGANVTDTQFYEEMQFKFEGSTLRTHYRSDTGNRIRGADGALGTSVLRPWWSGTGVEIQRAQQVMDGENAFVLSKTSGFEQTSNGQLYSGSVAVGGGESALQFHSVRPGQTIGFSMEVKSINAGTLLDGVFQFLDANWNVIPTNNTWTTNEYGNTSAWQTLSGTYVVPANAVFAILQVQMRRPVSIGIAAQSGAVRRIQIVDLPAGATAMPSWSGSGFDAFDQANFFADVGYSNIRSNLSANNFFDDSQLTGNISLFDVEGGGNDVFLAGSGNDTLGGASGNDWLDGNDGADVVYGGDGDDVLLGGSSYDQLFGGTGDDVLVGGADGDLLFGDAGNDTLDGGFGWSYNEGGEGDDVILAGRGSVVAYGGSGSDTISYRDLEVAGLATSWPTWLAQGNSGILFSLFDGWALGAAADDNFTLKRQADGSFAAHNEGNAGWVENVEGSNFDDFIRGDGRSNRLTGLFGSDLFQAEGGDDIIEGGGSADKIDGQGGNDFAAYTNSQAAVWVDLSANQSQYWKGEGFGGDAEGDGFLAIENLEGSKFADTLKGDGFYNLLRGGRGDDWFVVTAGGDRFEGGEGFDAADFSDFTAGVTAYLENGTSFGAGGGISFAGIEYLVGSSAADSLTGSTRDETFAGGKGNDTITGGAGSDTYILNIGDGYDTFVDDASASNALVFGEGVTWSMLTFNAPSQGLQMTIRGTSDGLWLATNFSSQSGNNKIKTIDVGGSGAIEIGQINNGRSGTAAGEVIAGNTNAFDWNWGYEGNDTIYGSGSSGISAAYETADNIIIGGEGDDTIYTSFGDDTFIFERGHGTDRINDVFGGADRIVIGSTATIEDVIYKVVDYDLWVGLRDPSDSTLGANLVADKMCIVNGGIKYRETEFGIPTGNEYLSYSLVEHVAAGGAEINFTKLDVNWTIVENEIGNYNNYYPVVLDLGNDGADLVSVETSQVVFKPDNNAPMYQTGWVHGDDGILALDRDGDGAITKMSEISFIKDFAGAKTDMEGLKAFDTNNDGKLSASDTRFGEFRVWRDINQNGRGRGKELQTLAQVGITSINLQLTATGFTTKNARDNVILNTTSFTRSDGTSGTANDVALGGRLAHITGPVFGKGNAQSKKASFDGELGRAKTVGSNSLLKVTVASGAITPTQNLEFIRADAGDGTQDLPAVVKKLRTFADIAAAGSSGASAGTAAPLVIDLGGDGIDLIEADKSSIWFDLNNDGMADRLGWAGKGEGILALDRDLDGLVQPLSEISFTADLPGAKTDLEGLKAFDSNEDDWLTSEDAQFGNFMIWKDENQDGQSNYEELITLHQAGITKIGLVYVDGPVRSKADIMASAPALVAEARTSDMPASQVMDDGAGMTALSRAMSEKAKAETVSATAAAPAQDLANTKNRVFGHAEVHFKDGRIVRAADTAFGSINGLSIDPLASSAQIAKTASTNPYDALDFGQPWSMNAAQRRQLMESLASQGGPPEGFDDFSLGNDSSDYDQAGSRAPSASLDGGDGASLLDGANPVSDASPGALATIAPASDVFAAITSARSLSGLEDSLDDNDASRTELASTPAATRAIKRWWTDPAVGIHAFRSTLAGKGDALPDLAALGLEGTSQTQHASGALLSSADAAAARQNQAFAQAITQFKSPSGMSGSTNRSSADTNTTSLAATHNSGVGLSRSRSIATNWG